MIELQAEAWRWIRCPVLAGLCSLPCLSLIGCESSNGRSPFDDRVAEDQGLVIYHEEFEDPPTLLTPSVHLGLNGRPFSRVLDVDVSRDGRVLVLDDRATEIRVFTMDGTELAALAREGQGPGELQAPDGLAIDPQNDIWVSDSRRLEVMRFSSGGEVETFQLPRSTAIRRWEGSVTSDGQLAIRMDENHAEGRTDPGIIEGNLVTSVVWHDPETQTGDTIEVGRTVGRTAVIPRLAGFRVPLMPETLVAIDPAGSVWTAHSDRYEVIRLTSGGDTSLVVRVDAERNGNGDSLRDDAIDEIRDWFEERGVMSIDWNAAVPETPPILASLFVDGDGRVWVQRAGKGLPVFDVFTTDGELAGRYRLDARLVDWISPVAQGGWLVAVTEDEYGASGVVIVPVEH